MGIGVDENSMGTSTANIFENKMIEQTVWNKKK